MTTHHHPHPTIDSRIGFFDHHAPKWEQDPAANARTLERLSELKSCLGLFPNLDVLEVGCGTGLATGWLLDCVRPGRVLAVDFSPAMLVQAQAKGLGAEFRCLDVCHETPEIAAFDVVLCFNVFPHFRDQLAALRHLAAALRPDGRLLVLHLAGSTQINEFHRGLAGPVCRDRLPASAEWPALLQATGLRRLASVDQPDLFLMEATHNPAA